MYLDLIIFILRIHLHSLKKNKLKVLFLFSWIHCIFLKPFQHTFLYLRSNKILRIKKTKRYFKWPSMQRWQCPNPDGSFKAVSYQVWIRYHPWFCFLVTWFIFSCRFFAKVTCAFLNYKKQWRNIWIKHF